MKNYILYITNCMVLAIATTLLLVNIEGFQNFFIKSYIYIFEAIILIIFIYILDFIITMIITKILKIKIKGINIYPIFIVNGVVGLDFNIFSFITNKILYNIVDINTSEKMSEFVMKIKQSESMKTNLQIIFMVLSLFGGFFLKTDILVITFGIFMFKYCTKKYLQSSKLFGSNLNESFFFVEDAYLSNNLYIIKSFLKHIYNEDSSKQVTDLQFQLFVSLSFVELFLYKDIYAKLNEIDYKKIDYFILKVINSDADIMGKQVLFDYLELRFYLCNKSNNNFRKQETLNLINAYMEANKTENMPSFIYDKVDAMTCDTQKIENIRKGFKRFIPNISKRLI